MDSTIIIAMVIASHIIIYRDNDCCNNKRIRCHKSGYRVVTGIGYMGRSESCHIITHHDVCVHDSYPTINNHHYTKSANMNNNPSHLSSPSTIIDPLTIIPGHLHNYTNIINLTIIYPHNDENNIEIMRRCSSYGSYGYNRIRWTDTR